MASVDHPPLILVSHLPSAASFYSALTQPLGLQFLSATSTIPACLHFGYLLSTSSGPRKITVFTVSQSAHPRLSHITLSAPTPKAVFDFHGRSQLYRGATRGNSTIEQNGIEERALTSDFDGNVIEAVYGSSALVRSAGMAPGLNKECKRVLEWQQDVARSISGSEVGGGGVADRAGAPVLRRAETCPTGFGCEHPTRIVVRETVTEHFANAGGPEVSAPPEPKSGGISSKTVLGTLLGAAAASAAIAYAMTRSESPPKPTGRRASEPQYTREPIVMEDRERVVEAGTIAARSHVSERDKETGIRPRYAIAAPPGPPALSRVQELAKIEEGSCVSTSSHRSSRSKKDRETAYERPLAILPAPGRERSPAADVDPDVDVDVDTKSHASRREKSPDADTRSHVSHRSHRSHRSRRSESGTGSERGRRREEREAEKEKEKDKDKESEYMSARSHHTASTIKPFKASSNTMPAAPQPPPATSASRVSTSSRSSKHHHHDNSHKDGSRVSASGRRSSVSTARPAPLPRSMVSGLGRDAFSDSNSNSDDEGVNGPFGKGSRYAASVAPSDSVSSVGTKRERERLAERMVFRERARGVLWGHS